jgi:hypothetical protein
MLGGHDRVVLHNFLDDPQGVLDEIKSIDMTDFDCYKNPFESKWTLNKEKYKPKVKILGDYLPPSPIEHAMHMLSWGESTWWVSHLLDVPIEYCDTTHYGGVFIYPPRSYLKPHVDAGRHPRSKQVKVATAVLYLTPAQLIFWKGEPAWYDSPTINQIDEVVNLQANDVIFFLNHDTAYHEVPIVGSQQRVCVTVSYIAPPDFKDPRFMNERTRAYFARHISHKDTSELAELRIRRSSEETFSEVYRT